MHPPRGRVIAAITDFLRLERELHPTVAYGILPLFAFANAGVPLKGVTLASFGHAVPAGIALGLVAGKALGVLGAVALAVKLGLAFEEDMARLAVESRLGILCGSAVAGLAGYLVLRLAPRS
jgi:NhaA family Na+:H+ antiporter